MTKPDAMTIDPTEAVRRKQRLLHQTDVSSAILVNAIAAKIIPTTAGAVAKDKASGR